MKITRRSLAMGLTACGALAEVSPLLVSAAGIPPAVTDASEWAEVFPGVWRATIGSPERFSPVSSRLVSPKMDSFRILPRVTSAPIARIGGSVSARGCLVQLPLRPNEQVFGLGLQFMSFSQRGKKKVTRVNADPLTDAGDSHAPVPFFVTTEGIGILIDTARYAEFYFGDARLKPTEPQASLRQENLDPNYTNSIQLGDRGTIVVEVPRAPGVDVYLFGGPEMIDAVRRYNAFSGGGVLPPEWGLGFWYRMDARSTQRTATDLASEFRDHQIPCDVLGLEPGWQTHAYSCTFEWNSERFEDPKGLIRSLSDSGYKVNLWEHAFTHPASPLFPKLIDKSGSHGVWGGLVPDFAGDAARDAFGAYHGEKFVDIGVSGFKLDECDNSEYTGGWSFPELSTFPSGVDGEQMHSVFGLRYQMAIWNEFRKRNKNTYGLVRSSGALAAPYPFVLYSDLYNHRAFIRALVNSGFSGLLWCPEVRDAATEEDLIRRLQSVVFSPLAMINGWYIKNPPWKQLNRKQNNADEFLDDWPALERRCREIIGWRMQLVPYLTAAFQRYREDGTPPFRAVVFEDPRDQRLYKVDDQYMVGDRMMVAPLFAGEPSRKVVFPAGRWHDFWSGKSVDGGTEITVAAEVEKIPVYVRAGSILPWADVGLYAETPESRRLKARVYGDGSNTFSFHSGSGIMRLSWTNGSGKVEGNTGSYRVYAWEQIG